MKKISKRIVFFGNEQLATGVTTDCQIFNGLIDAGYLIEALIISFNNPGELDNQNIVKIAKKHNIKILNLDSLKESVNIIRDLQVDVAILAAYGKIVPQVILDVFKIGIINIHPSLLPKHRGPTPIESAIISGDKETGVSIMKLVKEMDAGPIYIQASIKVEDSDSKQQIVDKLSELGKQLLLNNLEKIIIGQLVPTAQIEDQATYDKLITKEDGLINWNQTSMKIFNQVRAYAGWPRSSTTLSGLKVIVTKAHLSNNTGKPGEIFIEGNKIGVFSSDGLVLIESLIPEGKKEMSAESFLAGYRGRFSN